MFPMGQTRPCSRRQEKQGDYDIELDTRSQELGGVVVKPLARGGMAQVKGSVAKSRGGTGQGTHRSSPWGKELIFNTGHTPEDTHSRLVRIFLLPYIVPPLASLLEQGRAIKYRNTSPHKCVSPAYSILGGEKGEEGWREGALKKIRC